jgi:hypothetical protein
MFPTKVLTSSVRMLLLLTFIAGLCSDVDAEPITLTFSGTQLTVMGEFVNGVPVQAGQQEFAPLFSRARSITATISYDTAQPDSSATVFGVLQVIVLLLPS